MAKDYKDQKHNRLTFIKPVDQYQHAKRLWEVQCDCGVIKILPPADVVRGAVKSCGCLNSETRKALGKKNRKHDPKISSAKNVWHKTYHDCDFDLFLKLSQMPCYYCGRLPDKSFNVGNQRKKLKLSVSELQLKEGNFVYNGLDRIDSSLGHVPDNVVPCCAFCNYMKLDYTQQEFIDQIDKIYTHLHSNRKDQPQ